MSLHEMTSKLIMTTSCEEMLDIKEEKCIPPDLTTDGMKQEPEESQVKFAPDVTVPPEGLYLPIKMEIKDFEEKKIESVILPVDEADIERRYINENVDEIQEFYCTICNILFDSNLEHEMHFSEHKVSKVFKCDVCDKHFSRKTSLICHQRNHSGSCPYTCEICKKSFSVKSSKNRHMQLHSGTKNFCCDICNKAFSSKGSLVGHIRIHTGSRPYHCEFCGKSFTDHSTLKQHCNTHKGLRPYLCHKCNKTYTRKNHLNCHIKSHVKESQRVTNLCFQRLIT
ncbi:hypothetical protein C0J52_05454 [Blattella germanica]|nr:hypothetical protein C0J52_05454 [Blattella germanica]